MKLRISVLLLVALWLGAAVAQEAANDVDLENHHADPSVGLSGDNLGQPSLAWFMPTMDPVSHQPLPRDGRAYFAEWGGNVYAVDTQSGETVWKKKVQEQVMAMWPWHGFAGTGALGTGDHANRLFEASVEGNAFAIDTETGDVVWQTKFADDEHAGNVGRISYFNGMVIIGLASVEEPLSQMMPDFEVNFQGSIVALNADTGEEMWRTKLVEAPSTGVPVWSSFAVDPETEILYTTTGNNYTGEPTDLSDALIAMDVKTGQILWAHQVTENDVWTMAQPKGPDWDFGAGPQLFEATINGEQRQLVGAGQKSAVFYAWDRTTGTPVWSTVVGQGEIGGGIHGEASIGSDRILIWGNNAFPYAEPADYPMDIAAVDPATGSYLWVNPEAQPALQISAGFLAGDVYFVGSLDGMVRAYQTDDGKKLWTSEPHGSVASTLSFEDGVLLWGTGVPGNFGGKGPFGVVAYTVSSAGQ